jgi:two-component system NtrC family sensor kinase
MDEIFSLHELSYLLVDTISIDRIADQVAQFVMRFIQSDGVLVAFLHPGPRQLSVIGASGSLESLRGKVSDLTEASVTTMSIVNERIETASGSETHPARLIENHDVAGRAASVPLQAHGEILGALALVRDSTVQFDDTDLRLLSTAATHAALALGNARFVELIRSGKDQWEATFDAITDGIAVIDGDGRIRRGNQALATLLETPVVALIGCELTPLLVSEPAVIDDVIAGSRTERSASHITRSDTLNRVLRVTAASMDDAHAWTVMLIEDVTEQKALEAAVIQSEKMAAVGQLVSGVAHELNNPLTSISGLTEFLLQQPYIETRGREHLNVVREQADRAAAIVRNLLTFARQGSPGSEHVDINDVVEQTAALTRYEMQLREIAFHVNLDPELPPVFGDRFQLQQVVLNLVTNAIHAVGGNLPDRDRVITVRSSQADGRIVLDVADSGPGMSREEQKRVFDPFYTTKDPGEGTGLGLAITYGIVQAHGGDIRVTASDEGGGRFVVSLPAAEPKDESPVKGAAERRPAHPDSTGTVLLVDRDEAVRQMIHLVFSHVGHDVVIADAHEPPDSAFDLGDYDLIVADPRIPVSSGDSLGDWLRREHRDMIPRTIFLTADVREETMQWLEGIGCRFFHKPFNVQELKTAADEILTAPQDM